MIGQEVNSLAGHLKMGHVLQQSLMAGAKDLVAFLNKAVGVVQSGDPIPELRVPEALQGPCIFTEVELTEGHEGKFGLVWGLPAGLFTAGCLLMWEPEVFEEKLKACEVGAEEQDAIGEVFNLFVGGINKVMHKQLDAPLALKRTFTQVMTLGEQIELEAFSQEGSTWRFDLNMDGFTGPAPMGLFLPEPAQGYFSSCAAQAVSASDLDAAEPAVVKPQNVNGALPAEDRGATVLTVDDTHMVRRIIRSYLERKSLKVLDAQDGLAALALLSRENVDVVLLDIMMPKMDGFEVCRHIRKQKSKDELPIIMCSAKGTRNDIVEAIRAGANDFIIKPFDQNILVKKVQQALSPAD